MPSENYNESAVAALPSSIDNSLLLQDVVTDKLFLSLELLMLVLFILSVVYGIKKSRKRKSLLAGTDLEDVQSVLRDVAQQRKRANVPDEHDSTVCNVTTTEDKSGRGLGGRDDGVQLSGIVV